MQKSTSIVIGIVILIIGTGLGYFMGTRGEEQRYAERYQMPYGTHVMPGGQMMGNGSSMNMADMMTSMNAGLLGKSGDAFDEAFLSEMIVHHQGAVQMAELALQKAKHQEVLDLASGIITAQNKEIGEMKGWQKSWFNK